MRFFFEREEEQGKQQVVYCGTVIFAGIFFNPLLLVLNFQPITLTIKRKS